MTFFWRIGWALFTHLLSVSGSAGFRDPGGEHLSVRWSESSLEFSTCGFVPAGTFSPSWWVFPAYSEADSLRRSARIGVIGLSYLDHGLGKFCLQVFCSASFICCNSYWLVAFL